MYRRIISLLMLSIITVSFVIVLFEKNKIKSVYNKETENRLSYLSEFIDEFISNKKTINNTDKNTISDIFSIWDSYLKITDQDGKVIYNSTGYLNSEIKDISKGLSSYKSKKINKEIYVYKYINKEFKTVQILSINRKESGIAKTIYINLFIAISIGIVISFFIASFFAKSITRPIEEMKKMTESISSGNYSKRVHLIDSTELGLLAENFNEMADMLVEKINKEKWSDAQKNAILSSVGHGVLAVDRNKNILFSNKQAEELLNFKSKKAENKNILRVLRNIDIDNELDSILNKSIFKSKEIIFKRKSKDISVNLYPIIMSEEIIGATIILEDITEKLEMLSMRKEFVDNVAHELKTPLTSIKGFSETLLRNKVDEENKIKFIKIIDTEVDTLNELVDSLFVLNEIEKKEKKSDKNEVFSAKTLLNEIEELYKNFIKDKDIEINFENNMDDINTYGSASLFKTMITNIIQNGIKYSKKNQIAIIDIKSYSKKRKHFISIKDNGIGINKKFHERIFERFFRTDPTSASKKGSGLGLAIVKHIIIALDGKISLKSKIGEGSIFFIEIPKVN